MAIQEYFIKYDIDTKTKTKVENGEVMDSCVLEFCPYVWFGKLKEDVEAGIVKFVMWKHTRLIQD